MLRERRLTRLAGSWLAALVCLLPAGCIVPYAYPHLLCVPPVQLPPSKAQVHAFRVEGKGRVQDAGHDTDEFTLARIECRDFDRVPLQFDASLDYGLYIIGVVLNIPVHHGNTLAVRLYRRGTETVEVRSGELPNVEWKPAATLKAREEAIDALVRRPAIWCPLHSLQFGRTWSQVPFVVHSLPTCRTQEHREVLLFVAEEYEATAKEFDQFDEHVWDVRRLREKAQKLREAAEVTSLTSSGPAPDTPHRPASAPVR